MTKVDNIDTSDFVLKANYNTDKTELENKTPDTSGLVRKTNYNTKITELENKIPSVSNLVKKTDYNAKVTEIENKLTNHNYGIYIDTSEFNTYVTSYFY